MSNFNYKFQENNSLDSNENSETNNDEIDEKLEEIKHRLLCFSENINNPSEFEEFIEDNLFEVDSLIVFFALIVEEYYNSDNLPVNQRHLFENGLSDQVKVMIDLLDPTDSEYKKIIENRSSIFIKILLINDIEDYLVYKLIEMELDCYGIDRNEPMIPNILYEIDYQNHLDVLSFIVNNDNWIYYSSYIAKLLTDYYDIESVVYLIEESDNDELKEFAIEIREN